MSINDISASNSLARQRALLVRAFACLTPAERDELAALVASDRQDAVTAAFAALATEPHLKDVNDTAAAVANILSSFTYHEVEAIVPGAILAGVLQARANVPITPDSIQKALAAMGVDGEGVKSIVSRVKTPTEGGAPSSILRDFMSAFRDWVTQNPLDAAAIGVSVFFPEAMLLEGIVGGEAGASALAAAKRVKLLGRP